MSKFITRTQYVTLTSDFIRNVMPSANATFVKVYLYALDLAVNNIDLDNAGIAQALGILESDVVQAVTYWYQKGLLIVEDGVVEFLDTPARSQPQAPKSAVSERASYTAAEVSKAVEENKSLADMYTLSQEVLGKPLTTQEMQTLYWFYDELSLPPEVILMLLEYCVSKGKRSMNYIEKVAISWNEHGITTMEAVDRYITQEQEQSDYFYALRKILGIADRKLSKTEEEFLRKWRDTFRMSEEMIALAYEYCVIQTSKLSFPYMDKIMERWNKTGIHTILEAEQDNENFKKSNTQAAPSKNEFEVYQDHYDHHELEDIIRRKMKNG